MKENDFASVYVPGEISTQQALEGILKLMQDVYMPEFLAENSWPDAVKKDFTGHLHKNMASITEAVFEAKGKTVLYIPNEDLGPASDVARDKDLVQRLESTTIHWTRQIKEVVNQYEGSETQLFSFFHQISSNRPLCKTKQHTYCYNVYTNILNAHILHLAF